MTTSNIITSASESTRDLIHAANDAKQLAGNLTHSAMKAIKAEIDALLPSAAFSSIPEHFWGHVDELLSEDRFNCCGEYLSKFPQQVKDLLGLWFRLYTTIN